VAGLIEAGASNHRIHELIFDNFSERRTRFVGYCIKEKLVVLKAFNTAYISVTRDELRQYSHQSGDTEGIVNYGLGIRGIRLAAFFSEREGIVKISFRSKGDFSVKELAARHFSGGGHRNAAGGRSSQSLEETIARFVSILPQYKDALTS
jgi:phosphoesterase RecJ-like protein